LILKVYLDPIVLNGLVYGTDYLYGPSAFLAIDGRFFSTPKGVDRIFKIALMPKEINRLGISGTGPRRVFIDTMLGKDGFIFFLGML
jgi:hypothetical protein